MDIHQDASDAKMPPSATLSKSSLETKFYVLLHPALLNGIVTQEVKSMNFWTEAYPGGTWTIHDSFRDARNFIRSAKDRAASVTTDESSPKDTQDAPPLTIQEPHDSTVSTPIDHIHFPSVPSPSQTHTLPRANPFAGARPSQGQHPSPWHPSPTNVFSPPGLGFPSPQGHTHPGQPTQVPLAPPPGPSQLHAPPTPQLTSANHVANVWKYFELPTWDGSDQIWIATKMKMTTALQKCGMQYLLAEPSTTPTNAYHSQIFAIGMLDSFTGEALHMFLGRHEHYWRTHGIEMFHKLLTKYESATPDSILSLETKWGDLKQLSNESFTVFCNRVELLAFCLHKDEVSMVSNALRGMLPTYNSFKQNVMTGSITILSMEDLKMKVENFSRISSFLSPNAPNTIAKASAVTALMDNNTTNEWSPTMAAAFLGKFKCGLCRQNTHTIARCYLLTKHLQKYNFEIMKKMDPALNSEDKPQN